MEAWVSHMTYCSIVCTFRHAGTRTVFSCYACFRYTPTHVRSMVVGILSVFKDKPRNKLAYTCIPISSYRLSYCRCAGIVLLFVVGLCCLKHINYCACRTVFVGLCSLDCCSMYGGRHTAFVQWPVVYVYVDFKQTFREFDVVSEWRVCKQLCV